MGNPRIAVDSTEHSQNELANNCASAFLDELNEDFTPPAGKDDKQPPDVIPAAGKEPPKVEVLPAPRNGEVAGEPQQKPADANKPVAPPADKKPVQDKPTPGGGEERKPEVPAVGGGVEPRKAPDAPPRDDNTRRAPEEQPPVAGNIRIQFAPLRTAEHPLLPKSKHPELANASEDELERIAKMPLQMAVVYDWAIDAQIEIIRRSESMLNAEEIKDAKKYIPIILKSLKEGKMIEQGPDNQPFIGDKPLDNDLRMRLHQAVIGDLVVMTNQANSKMRTAGFLFQNKQYKDAQDYALWAKESADKLPIDLLREEAKQLKADIALYDDPQVRAEFLRVSDMLATDGKNQAADTLPIQTRKMLTVLYMGTEFKNDGRQVTAEFGKTTGFKPERAFEMAKETREKTKEILGFDPLDEKQARQDPEVASLFGGICEMINNPEKYNMYKLVDEYTVERMKKELKPFTGTDSMLADIGVVGFTTGVLALSRSPKVQAALEGMVGRVLPGAEKSVAPLTRAAGIGTAAIGAPLVRHYGYNAISGLDEKWSDTAVHVVGSLAAAELGGRVLGQGSMLTGRPGRGVTALQQFDKVGSAEWLSLQGYNTTGKMADLLKSSGYTTEATIFANVPRTTKLTSEAGLKLIEQANLTNSRLATVAKSVAQDVRAASGFDSVKVAESLGKSTNGKIATVDDIAKLIEQDKKVLEEFLSNAGSSKNSALVSDALSKQGWTADSHRLAEAVEKLGVKNVGEAEQLLAQLKKGMSEQFPRVAELQAAGVANGATKLTDLAASGNRVLDGPGLDRLLSHVPTSERAGLFTDKIIDEVMSGIGKRTKIQEAVLAQSNVHSLPGVPSYFGVPAPAAVARSNWNTSLLAGGTIAGTYNSIVKTWDYMQQDNPQTGQPYTLSEAVREAHFPTILDPNAPAALRYATSFLVGTPGQTVAAAFMLRPGAIHQGDSTPLMRNLPFSKTGWNNLNANLFSKPGMSGAGALGGTLWKPILEDSARNGRNNIKYKELLKNSQTPVENKPLPFDR